MSYRFIKDVPVRDRTVIIRVDLNSPLKSGMPIASGRFREHGKSISKLLARGAKLVVLAHQGQKGEKDFIGLEQHAALLSGIVGRKISFAGWKENYVAIISALGCGEAVLLDNVRFQPHETDNAPAEKHAKLPFIKSLASVADCFVLDALSVAHRQHASVVGLTALLPSFVGNVLKSELNAFEKIKQFKSGKLLVLGGAKIEDSLELMDSMLKGKKVDHVLLGGLFGELFLSAQGTNFGAKEKQFKRLNFSAMVPKAKSVRERFPSQISVPCDLAVDFNGIRKEISINELPSRFKPEDIGSKTIDEYCEQVSNASLVVFNGPMGVFEKREFALGTKAVLKAVAESSAFSILGGGHTETALEQLGFSLKQFSHVSLSGKALLELLAGKRLPGLDVLEAAE